MTEDTRDDAGTTDSDDAEPTGADAVDSDDAGSGTATVVVVDDEATHELTVPAGSNLRKVLLDAGHSPYTRLTERANCGGRGLCATCGVRVHDDVPPTHWHDALADRFGYPRLSCQLEATDGLVVELDDEKRVWGRRE